MKTQIVEIKVKSCAPYAKGWQVNAFVEGVESEQTYYGYSKKDAIESAKKSIQKNGRLLHEPYKGA